MTAQRKPASQQAQLIDPYYPRNYARRPEVPATHATHVDLSPDKTLVLRITITTDSERDVTDVARSKLLHSLHNDIVDAVRNALGADFMIRVNFYKGSLIIIIAISTVVAGALLTIDRSTLQYLSNDIKNIAHRVFRNIKQFTVDFKKVEQHVELLRDFVSIAAKMLQMFGLGLSPQPSFPGEWEPV